MSAPAHGQVLRISGDSTLHDCVSIIGILVQMGVLREISPGLHKQMRALNVHLAACFEIDGKQFRCW